MLAVTTPSVRRRAGAIAAALTTALVGAACSTVDSGDLRTSGMRANILVTAGEDYSTVAVSISAGGTTSVKLQGDDHLVARSGKLSDRLSLDGALGYHSYHGTLEGVTEPGTEVEVDLSRGSGDTSTTSTVKLPAEVHVLAPRPDTSTSRSRDTQFRVNPAAGAINVAWKGTCVAAGWMSFEEGVPLVVPARTLARLQPASGQPQPPQRCLVTWTVTRVATGTIGDEFRGGSIDAARSTSLVLRSTP
jgi:hypothetical protein